MFRHFLSRLPCKLGLHYWTGFAGAYRFCDFCGKRKEL